jgi:hypothetical protein
LLRRCRGCHSAGGHQVDEPEHRSTIAFVDGRDKPGHDGSAWYRIPQFLRLILRSRGAKPSPCGEWWPRLRRHHAPRGAAILAPLPAPGINPPPNKIRKRTYPAPSPGLILMASLLNEGAQLEASCCGAGGGACGCPDVPDAGDGVKAGAGRVRNPVPREADAAFVRWRYDRLWLWPTLSRGRPPCFRARCAGCGDRVFVGDEPAGHLAAVESGLRRPKITAAGALRSAALGIPGRRSLSARHPLAFAREKTRKETMTRSPGGARER